MRRKGIFQFLRRQAGAGIDDLYADDIADGQHFQFDAAARRILDRVVEQVAEDLLGAMQIGHDCALGRHVRDRDGEGQVAAAGSFGKFDGGAFAHQNDIDRLAADFDLAGLGAVIVDRRHQDRLQVPDGAQRGFDLLTGRRRPRQVLSGHAEILFDGGQSGLDLARQGFHQCDLAGRDLLAFAGGGQGFGLKAIVIAHVAVENETHGQGQHQAAIGQARHGRVFVDDLHGDHGAGHR